MTELVEMFARQVRNAPDRIVLHTPALNCSLRAAQLWSDACGIAVALEQAGLEAGSLVTLATGNDPATLAAWLACRMRSLALMPIERSATDAEVHDLTAAFGPCISIGRPVDPVAQGVVAGVQLIKTEAELTRPGAYAGAAVLKLTSGTTGRPKAVWATEEQLLADSRQIVAGMGIRPDDTQIGAIPLSHAYGIGNLVLPLLMQGTRLVLRESFIPQQLPSDATMFDARVFCGVPFMFEHFLQHQPASGWPNGLTELISAGARLDRTTQVGFQKQFGVAIHSFYGTSEAGGITFDAAQVPGCDESTDGAVVGVPLPGVTVTLRSPALENATSGQVHVKSSAVANGYVGPGAVVGAFVDDGFLASDLARFDARGRLVLTGRISGWVNVAGRKVQPEEVERVLRLMPEIAEAHVIGVADARRGEALVACLVPRGAAPNIFEVRQHCSKYLSQYKVPRWMVVMDVVPLTERGKPDRRRLQELATASMTQPGTGDVT